MGVGDVRRTAGPGDEGPAARRAVDDGADTLVAVGGDGTWGAVADAVVASGADVRLALAAAGTGNDFAKSLGAPAADFAATARLAVDGPDVRVDVGRVDAGGAPGRHFLNAVGFGFDVAVIEDVARSPWPAGRFAYAASALRQLFGYGGLAVGAGGGPARHLLLVVANGRHFGGTFRIAPDASLTDGRLDAIAIGDASALGRLRLFAAAARGAHVGHPEVVAAQAAAFSLTFAAPPAYQADGEHRRAASAALEVRCVPRALRVVTPAAGAAGRP